MSTDKNHTRVLNPHFLRVTPIDYSLGENNMLGTGFYYESMNDYYLVTNRHIVRHEYGVSPDEIRIKYRAEDSVERPKPQWIDLFDDDNDPRWYEHPADPTPDLAVVPLELDLDETSSKAFSADFAVPDQIKICGGDGAVIIGYPYDVLDQENSLPVMRSAVIASPYGANYNGKPLFLVDSLTQPGASGSPVITSSANMYFDQKDNRVPGGESLLGVLSGSVIEEENMGLYRVWYSELIEEIIQSGVSPNLDS